MRNILVEILCPNCFYHTHIKSHTLALPEIEPALRERILQDRLFRYECPRCHHVIKFYHDFLYRDVPHQFMIYMSKEQKELRNLQDQFPHTLIRCVTTPEELKELILPLEDGWNDYVIHDIEQLLRKKDQMVNHVRYHDYDAASETIWFLYEYDDRQELKAIEKQIYDHFMDQRKGVPYE